MKPLSEQSTDALKKRLEELEYALSGLAAMGGGVLPQPDVKEAEALRAELKRRASAK